MTQKDIFGNETKFFEKASFFNGAEFTGNVVIDGSLVQPSVWSVNEGNVYYTNGSMSVGTGSPNFSSFGSNTSGIEISDVDTNNALLVQSGSNELYFANTPTNNYIWGVNNVPLIFGTNDLERLRIASGGDVLMKNDLLMDNVNADILMNPGSNSGSIRVSRAGRITTNVDQDGNSNVSGASGGGAQIDMSTNLGIRFSTFPNTTSVGDAITLSEKLRIASGGNVGIGTDNPTAKLDVAGDVKVGANTSQGVILTSPNGTEYRLTVDNSGTLTTTAV